MNRTLFNEYKVWVSSRLNSLLTFVLITVSNPKKQTKKLMSVVDDIARNYNDDLLNMFRLN